MVGVGPKKGVDILGNFFWILNNENKLLDHDVEKEMCFFTKKTGSVRFTNEI